MQNPSYSIVVCLSFEQGNYNYQRMLITHVPPWHNKAQQKQIFVERKRELYVECTM